GLLIGEIPERLAPVPGLKVGEEGRGADHGRMKYSPGIARRQPRCGPFSRAEEDWRSRATRSDAWSSAACPRWSNHDRALLTGDVSQGAAVRRLPLPLACHRGNERADRGVGR